MIQFKNVSKTYKNGTKALQNVSIDIQDGEFVFVLGASGAGKSTFLKLMMREEVPSAGEVIINGYNLNTIPKRKIPYFRRTLGIVFQDFRLIPNMRVYDNVAFAMRVIGAKEKEISKRVAYVLSLVGLSSKAKALPNQLSGGEQQRVALARALANDADIIIADEPTGNIDPEMSYEIVDLLNHINANGTTVIMVTHEHALVKQFPGKRIITIRSGSVVSDTAKGDRPLEPAEKAAPRPELQSNYYDVPGESADVEHFLRTYGTDEELLAEEHLTELDVGEIPTGKERFSDPMFTSGINIGEAYNDIFPEEPAAQTPAADDTKTDVIRSGGFTFGAEKTNGGDEE
ncbi:MAG: cell division ATP-binding protein FtsE [Clostridia bacterium]|nr:cell division ATP-binding protein FtsE [Clostridia bacterium]